MFLKANNKNIGKMNFIIEHKYAFITLLGALIVGFSAFKASINQQKTEKEAYNLRKKLSTETAEVKRLSELTIKLQNENLKEMKHQTNLLTGGDSFPFIFPSFPHAMKGYFDLGLWHFGKYSLYDLEIRITDFKKMNFEASKTAPGRPIFIDRYTTNIHIGNMTPGTQIQNLYRLAIPNDGVINLKIDLIARNCTVVRKIKFTNANTDKPIKEIDEFSLNNQTINPDEVLRMYSK